MAKSDHYLSIVVPVYNEEESVKPLSDKIEESLVGFKYQLIFIDDFSTDNTRQAIRNLDNPNVFLIELKKNYGQSLALAAGIDFAEGDFIITMDGDLQNDPADIPKMIEVAETGQWDVVTGVRKNRKDSFVKTIPSKIANFIIRKATRLNLKDQGCALKVFSSETAKELNIYGEMHRFINLLSFLNGARIKEVDVNHHHRQFGESKYGLGRTFKVLNDLLLIIFQRKHLQKPMYLFGNIGLIFFALGALINLYLLIVKLMGNEIGDRPLLIVGVLFIIVGIQFVSLGVITDLLMRTYFESQRKRPYRIREIFSVKNAHESKTKKTINNLS